MEKQEQWTKAKTTENPSEMRSKKDEFRKENKVGHFSNLKLKYSVGLRYKMKSVCLLVCVHVHLCIRLV